MDDSIQKQIQQAGKEPQKNASNEQGILHKQLGNIQQEMTEKGIMGEAKAKGIPYISLFNVPLRSDVLHVLTVDEMTRARVAVFDKKGKELHVACVNADDAVTKQTLQSLADKQFTIHFYLCSQQSIDHALRAYHIGEKEKSIALATTLDEAEIPQLQKLDVASFANAGEKIKNMSSAEAVNYIELLAIQLGASDIHLEPSEAESTLRLRMDGVLRKIFTVAHDQMKQIITQIKHDAGLKINVSDVPQDGEMAFGYQDRKIRLRVSTLPTEYGDSVVMRLLDSKNALTDFDALGFDPVNLLELEKSLRISYGMILVTGPTGSGKTTTLYTALRHMKSEENKIITLEDPMEYALDGIVQSEIHEDEGFTFAEGLKSVLRQDPDVIMIGEIRDLPSAETAAQAALTGHVVLSTLHTNNALEAIPRMLNMGVKPFVLAPALHTVMAQRLLRVLCPKCKAQRAISESEKNEIASVLPRLQRIRPDQPVAVPTQVYDAKGCEECNHSGFKGRTIISEILVLDEELQDMIARADADDVFQKKVTDERNMLFMKEDGVLKVIAGTTTLAEVLRVVG